MKISLLFSVKVLITLLFSIISISSIYSQTTQTFISPGTTTWTVPSGVTSISIECWGGGGAGGNANTNPTGQQGAAGGGGKGGMYSITNLNVTANTVLTINVGAGGSNGSAGGTSWVSVSGGTPWINVNDGAWASGGNGASTTTAQGVGATAYAAPSSGSGTTYDGGNGAPGRRLAASNQAGGNGGGAGGTQSSGNDGIAATIAGSGNPTSASTGGAGGIQDGGNGGSGAYGSSGTANGGAGAIRGGGGGGARAKNGGSGSVSATGGVGGRGEIRITYTACPIPEQPVSITGLLAVCNGSTQTYSVPSDPAATNYTWTLPSGWSGTSTTNSIDVTVGGTGGTVSVVAESSCGNAPQQTVNVTVSNNIPNQPVAINGNLTVCTNVSQTYTIANNPTATSYTWTLPSGWSGTSTTNSINASVGTVGGIITVTANNACGNSTPQTANINVNNINNIVDLSGLTLTANQTGATYQWLDCDNGNSPILGEINQSFTPSANGNYAVKLTVSGCTDTSSCIIVNSVSIAETPIDNLTISPNPGNGIYTVVGHNFQDEINIKIYTAEGKTIFQEKGFSGKDAIMIDISIHPQGIYLMEIDNQTSIIYSKLIRQ